MFPESRWLPPDLVFRTDSCLSGCGSDGDYFHTQFPPDIMGRKGIAINELECLAILIAIRIWSYKLENKNLLLYCDNSSTVEIVNQGRACNHFAQSSLREIVWWCAKLNCWIKVCYLPGVDNQFSDLLSRWHTDIKYQQQFRNITRGYKTREFVVPERLFRFSHSW